MGDKVAIGIPFYGPQEGAWWSQLVNHVASLPLQGVEYSGLIISGAMAADHNRNAIVRDFLATDADWLFWIDADTIIPNGAIKRLLGLGKTLASGLYYGKGEPHPPIAYIKRPDGAYQAIDRTQEWERGEIIPIDAAGCGCLLSHRSVYEDIQKDYVVLQRRGGGIVSIHKDDVHGEIDNSAKHEWDGQVHKGQYRERLIHPTVGDLRFPYFALEFGRTEDMYFFERAARVGHKCWLDTSIECGHLYATPFRGQDYREYMGMVPK